MGSIDVARELQEKLSVEWNEGKYESKIHHIRFLYFKNLEYNLKITFDHPITALIGPNGTNKTSILRAVQGCPVNQNIGRFWFGTALDSSPGSDRPRFIYGRWSDSANAVVEMLKMRVRRSDSNGELDPDYWEPAESNASLGMAPMPDVEGEMPSDRTVDRWSLLKKNVVYLDFRSEISAYDKYFFHHEYRRRSKDLGSDRVDHQKRRKSLIRDRSRNLRNIIDRGLKHYYRGGSDWVIAPSRKLTPPEIYWVSHILGREYKEITVVEHKAFQVEGVTALLRTSNHSYSEAWAGSGEFAVIQLVVSILEAKKNSLIILDEPEVSLYPGAQRGLMGFLTKMADSRHHQFVFATHSPILVEALPSQALKVFELDRDTGSVRLRGQGSSSHEAFHVLGHNFEKKTVVVEDSLAQEIVLRAIRLVKPSLVDVANVTFYPGGETVLRDRDLPSWSRHGEDKVLLLLDGDVLKKPEDYEPKTGLHISDVINANRCVPSFGETAPDDVEATVEAICKVKNIPKDSGEAAKRDFESVLNWSSRYLRFLPGTSSPEEWLFAQCNIDPLEVSETTGSPGTKEWWCNYVTREMGLPAEDRDANSGEILHHQKIMLAKLDQRCVDLVTIGQGVKEFVEG